MAVGDDLQLTYTLDDQQTTNPYHANILRTNVNRAISSYIPDILDESILAIQETFDANDGLYILCFLYIGITALTG